MKNTSFKNSLRLAAVLLFAMVSCKAPKTLTTERLKLVSTNRLIKNVEENAFNYSSLDIKRIACQYETPENKTSFKASLKSEKDNHIFLTFSKMNVPVGRVLLTPDSVKMINYINKTYFLEDYAYLGKFIGADLDFNVVQSIISNDVFSYRDDPKDNDYREFVSYIDSGMYVLQSFKNRKLGKITRKGKEDKMDRYLKKLDEEDFIVQYLYIDPKTYKIRRVLLDDKSNARKVNVDFDEFIPFDNQLYPGSIEIHFTSPENDLKMKVKLSKFSTENDPEINFNIPEKYNRTN